MRERGPFSLLFLCRGYALVALVIGGAFAPPAYAAIPWLALLLYLYLELRGGPARLRVPLHMFLALSLPLLLKPLVGVWASAAFTLPLLPLLDRSLRQAALSYGFATAREGRQPTGLCLSLSLSVVAVGLAALALGSWGLLLSCILVGGYLAGVMGLALRRTSLAPLEAQVANHRVVAGDLARASVRLANRSALGGQLHLVSPYPWCHIRPGRLLLDRPELEVEASFTPPLAGPTVVACRASFLDPWGLVRVDFGLEMLRLFVIPRARYAEWLARRYLETSRPGGQEALTSAAPATQRASRKGVEFFSLRSYQPGDSAKSIDWKHTLKLHRVTVKEFLDTGVEGALLAVNLSVADEEEKDKLAYSLITTALTLARENIPSALAAYSHEGVVMTSRRLDPRQALLQALSLAGEIRVALSPLRYLGVPDVSRLRGNLYRLRQSRGTSAMRLAEVLQMEYAALGRAARENPVTAALAAALAAVNGKVNIVILSGHNHDAEALAFSQHALKERGYGVLDVELGRTGQGITAGAAIRRRAVS